MKIKSFEMKRCEIPFRISFSHNSAKRDKTQAFVAVVELESGTKGYGEGCPRSYVTGETIESGFEFFKMHRSTILEIGKLEELRFFLSANQQEIDQNPSACCAVEMALLDAMSREREQSIEKFLGLEPLSNELQYTAVLGVNDYENFAKQFRQYGGLGFQDYKVKLSGNLEQDRKGLQLVQGEGSPGIRIRVDANNLWDSPTIAIEYLKKMDCEIFAVEEPLKANDYPGCEIIYESLEIPIILDESFIFHKQFESISENIDPWIINIRVSKMGGVLRTLAVMEKARELGIPMIVGAQVGETSLLTRASMTVSSVYQDQVLAREGAFGTLLLSRDIVDKPITLGQGGKIQTSDFINGHGWGLSMQNLESLGNE